MRASVSAPAGIGRAPYWPDGMMLRAVAAMSFALAVAGTMRAAAAKRPRALRIQFLLLRVVRGDVSHGFVNAASIRPSAKSAQTERPPLRSEDAFAPRCGRCHRRFSTRPGSNRPGPSDKGPRANAGPEAQRGP